MPTGDAVLFFASLAITLLTASNAIIQPTERWRTLAAMSKRMQGAIWEYRCVVMAYVVMAYI